MSSWTAPRMAAVLPWSDESGEKEGVKTEEREPLRDFVEPDCLFLASSHLPPDSLEMDGLEISLIKDLVTACFTQGFACGAQPL